MEKIEIKGSELFKAGFCVAAGVTTWKVVDNVFYHFLKRMINDYDKKHKEEKANEKSNV